MSINSAEPGDSGGGGNMLGEIEALMADLLQWSLFKVDHGVGFLTSSVKKPDIFVKVQLIYQFYSFLTGLGSILDTVSKDTEDTANSNCQSYLYLRYIFRQLLLMVSVSEYL